MADDLLRTARAMVERGVLAPRADLESMVLHLIAECTRLRTESAPPSPSLPWSDPRHRLDCPTCERREAENAIRHGAELAALRWALKRTPEQIQAEINRLLRGIG